MCDSPVQQDTRYDRQLRLWGEHGQAILEASRVLIIGVNTTSCEVAKNLILPGIGRLILMDNTILEHVMSNFFHSEEDIGKNVAEAAFPLLAELNPIVKCSYDERNVNEVLASHPEFFTEFSLVIASRISRETQEKLEDVLFPKNIPFVQVESVGMFGRIRALVREHAVLEANQDHTIPDLRLDKPFPALKSYLSSFDLEKMDQTEHKHVPYVVPLFKALEVWRAANAGTMPNYKGKKDIKATINSLRRFDDEENFDEAIAAVNTIISPTEIPSSLSSLLSSDEFNAHQLRPSSSSFWIMLKALDSYLKAPQNEGLLPLNPTVPDMFSSSDLYVKLVKVYREKSNRDIEAFTSELSEICSSIGVEMPDESLVKRFCINSRGLQLHLHKHNTLLTSLNQVQQPGSTMVMLFILFEASLIFKKLNSRFPGDCEDIDLPSDIVLLNSYVSNLTKSLDTECTVDEQLTSEFVRSGGTEFNSVASYIGGLASQEAIKFLTGQYVPIRNTLVYNAVTEEVETFLL